MIRLIRYRLGATPAQPLPLNVRSCGSYRFDAGHHESRGPGNFLQVFWCAAGSGRVKFGRAAQAIRAGLVFYYAAGEAHDLQAGPEGFDYHWLTFDGERFPTIARDFRLSRVQSAGPCPVHLFEQLELALREPTLECETRASVLAYEILLRSTSGQSAISADDESTEGAEAAKAWLDAHFTDARLNVAALSARFHLHRSSLHRLFARHYGVAPVQYLQRLRLRFALELLGDTRLPIAEVAVRCGLPDVAYFSKLVTRHTGYSPRAYRQHHAAATRS